MFNKLVHKYLRLHSENYAGAPTKEPGTKPRVAPAPKTVPTRRPSRGPGPAPRPGPTKQPKAFNSENEEDNIFIKTARDKFSQARARKS